MTKSGAKQLKKTQLANVATARNMVDRNRDADERQAKRAARRYSR